MSVKANNLHENAEYFIRLLNFSPSFASIKVLAAKYENRVTVQCFLAIPSISRSLMTEFSFYDQHQAQCLRFMFVAKSLRK